MGRKAGSKNTLKQWEVKLGNGETIVVIASGQAGARKAAEKAAEGQPFEVAKKPRDV